MDYQKILDQIYSEVNNEPEKGKVADYIPALAKIDPEKFGIAIHTIDGKDYSVGNADEFFSIQSIAKVLTLTLAMQQFDEKVWNRVGKEPSGTPFNSLVQLESSNGIPRNPFMNAGALVITDMINENAGRTKMELIEFVRELSGNKQVSYDFEVADSEEKTGYRNRALANFIKSYNNLENEPDDVLDVYYHQSAIRMSCVDLSRAFIYLANGGYSTIAKKQILNSRQTKRVNSVMLIGGLYDAAGDFAYKVGLPGKSGVGGGIIAVIPGKLIITVWSPELNKTGNSAKGLKALELFTTYTGISVF